jgi:Cof subfamily protein (haloacid dehalogenase superfamily)
MRDRVLALDIDGTLLYSDGSISSSLVDFLLNLQSNGVILCLSSGRPTLGILPIANMLQMQEYGGYIISFNGAELFDCKEKKVLYKASLPQEAIPVVVECGRREGHAMLTYASDRILTEKPDDAYVLISHKRNEMPVQRVDDFEKEVDVMLSKCIITGDPCEMPALQREVTARLYGVADAYLSEPYFLEVVRKGVDKADALARLLDLLKLSHKNLIAAGDGHNDFGMIKLADIGIAMGNAHIDVREIADIVAPHTDEDGLLQVLEKIFAVQFKN